MIAVANDIFNDDLLLEVIEYKTAYRIELKYIIGYGDLKAIQWSWL